MKTSAVLASLLFGSFAVAAPFDKRALVYKTEVVTETVVVYTTVWDDDEPVAQATTTPAGYFYEVPKAPSSAPAKPTSQAPAAEKPADTYVAPAPQAPTTTPAAAPSPAPVVEQPKPVVQSSAPAPVVEQPKTEEAPKPTTSAYVAPAPVNTPAPAPAYTAPSTPSTGGGSGGAMEHQDVDITIYDNTGAAGACGEPLNDDMMIVALAAPTWGSSTYDVMTGKATNPWCGQKIDIEYNGNKIQATIMDLCPGCKGADIDLSLSAWKALTKLDEKTRLKASWSKAN